MTMSSPAEPERDHASPTTTVRCVAGLGLLAKVSSATLPADSCRTRRVPWACRSGRPDPGRQLRRENVAGTRDRIGVVKLQEGETGPQWQREKLESAGAPAGSRTGERIAVRYGVSTRN